MALLQRCQNRPLPFVERANDAPPRVELIGAVARPLHNGPTNGMFALQQALRRRIAAGLNWLSIEATPQTRDVLPWFWCWEHRSQAVAWVNYGLPFVQGPNVLFTDSRQPRIDADERTMLDAGSCRLMFCHSEWYRNLICAYRGSNNRSPITLWPYPIEPKPGGPLTAEFDLMIYLKSGYSPAFVDYLAGQFPKHVKVQYGAYQREQLGELARRSRACVYLSDNESGGMAVAEMLLAGCPVVGMPTGAPFVRDGRTGFLVDSLLASAFRSERNDVSTPRSAIVEVIRAAHTLDRHAVRIESLHQFSTETIVDQVVEALDFARRSTSTIDRR
jgi:glycosyltransferase involved in cell wall biosynthesis